MTPTKPMTDQPSSPFVWTRGQPGRSILLLGPSGSGKSTVVRRALDYFGSGAVALAPGADESASYESTTPKAWTDWRPDGGFSIPEGPFLFSTFDDDQYFPSLPANERGRASGLANHLRWLRAVRSLCQRDIEEGHPPRYALLAQDTLSGLGTLAGNAMMSQMNITELPKARGDGGATYYGGYAFKMNEIMRAARALKGLGVNWIATSHTFVREVDSTKQQAMRAEPGGSQEQIVPIFTGAFRDQVAATFDLVIFTATDGKGIHYGIWKSDMRRTAKSRLGKLSDTDRIDLDWRTLWRAANEATHDGE